MSTEKKSLTERLIATMHEQLHTLVEDDDLRELAVQAIRGLWSHSSNYELKNCANHVMKELYKSQIEKLKQDERLQELIHKAILAELPNAIRGATYGAVAENNEYIAMRAHSELTGYLNEKFGMR